MRFRQRSPTAQRRRPIEITDFDMSRLDITEQNVAVEKVLAVTESPRHRYLLQSYLRHR
jgi:hypothetical protein